MMKRSYNSWTPKEEDFLKENYKTMTRLDIGVMLGRTEKQVANKMLRMKLKKHNHQKWSQDELDYIEKKYKVTPLKEVAAHLGRTENQCASIAKFYKFNRSRSLNMKECLDKKEVKKQNWMVFI